MPVAQSNPHLVGQHLIRLLRTSPDRAILHQAITRQATIDPAPGGQ